jgi:hypothetical protein
MKTKKLVPQWFYFEITNSIDICMMDLEGQLAGCKKSDKHWIKRIKKLEKARNYLHQNFSYKQSKSKRLK